MSRFFHHISLLILQTLTHHHSLAFFHSLSITPSFSIAPSVSITPFGLNRMANFTASTKMTNVFKQRGVCVCVRGDISEIDRVMVGEERGGHHEGRISQN